MTIDHTHDIGRISWVAGATGHPEFPLQNLPMGVLDEGLGRVAVAIGDFVLDVKAALDAGLLSELDVRATQALRAHRLNAWMGLDAPTRKAIRHAVFALLERGSAAEAHRALILRPRSECRMALPADIGDYTDFYGGIHHAIKAGSVFRPDNPLLPNYKHLPIAYHGRSSSITVSDETVRRPWGQVGWQEGSRLQLSDRMDFELELAMWAGPGNELGQPVSVTSAAAHIAGFGLFNDWSARDIQAWEYRPLGPFQGKNFASTVSPWVVTTDAVAPFRAAAMPRGDVDPPVLDYLLDSGDQKQGAVGVHLEVWLSTETMRAQNMPAHRLAHSHTKHLYWTPAQMVAQHTLGGCNLRPGDLMATGTISTPDDSGNGSLLEQTMGGMRPIDLPSGEERMFLCDGDEITLRGYCERDGLYRIGFGECRARIEPGMAR